LTQTGKTPTCPGECIHAITSILCDHVLEEVSCGEPFLRCCVPNDSSYGTAVETSPPLNISESDLFYNSTQFFLEVPSAPDYSLSSPPPPPSTSSSFKPSITENKTSNFLSTSFLNQKPSSTLGILASNNTSLTTTSYDALNPSLYSESINPKCPGVCVKVEYARYCGNIMSNGVCDHVDEECCLQSQRDSLNNSLSLLPSSSSSCIKGEDNQSAILI